MNLPLRLMFQDEARFGRISDPRKCWAPAPLRPMVKLALVREYVYAYAAVSPQDGVINWMLGGKMDTVSMGAFLRFVSNKHPEEFVIMVVDGASSHSAKYLRVPKNMALVKLPPYSPELNPVEHLWDELREKEFANQVFETLGAVIAQAARGLKKMEEHPDGLRSLTGWDWILRSI